MLNDVPLLEAYARTGSEQAFRELVTRHIDLVYSVAMRRVNGDIHLAQDIVQTVFSDLARKARTLTAIKFLGGWLYRHTFFVATQAIRRECRRRTREKIAVEMNLPPSTESSWDQIAPYLDEAIQKLGGKDRDAIVLRYFDHFDLKAVGEALGTTEEAARKRIDRALEKLRILLSRKNLTISSLTLVSLLGHQAVISAPLGMAAAVAGPAAAAALATPGINIAILKFMATTKLKIGTAAALVVIGTTTPFLIQHRALWQEREAKRRAQMELQNLRQEQAALSNQLDLASQAQSLSQEQKRDLMRLRAQVGPLRAATNELRRQMAQLRDGLKAPSAQADSASPTNEIARNLELDQYLPAEAWKDAGLNSPAAALQTFLWAGRQGNLQRLMDALQLLPEQRPVFESRMKEAGSNIMPFDGAKGVKVVAIDKNSSASTTYTCDFDWGEGESRKRIHFQTEKVNEAWKLKKNSQVEELPPLDKSNRPN